MAVPIVQIDLDARIGEAEVDRYAKAAGDGSVTARIAEAWDMIRSAALNIFTPASFDALTAATIPPEMRKHAVSLAVAFLASGSKHPDYLDTAAADAKQYLSFLAAGTVHYSSDVLVLVSSSTGGPRARVGAPSSRKFDADDTSGGLIRRHSFT